MSIKSQENNMRRLAALLGQNLSYIWGERECGPNGAKRTFLNVGKVFLRALAKDLGLRDIKVSSNAGGIGVSGECSLWGMWESNGIYICLGQIMAGHQAVLLYRTIRNIHDYKGGYNHFLTHQELQKVSYEQILGTFQGLRKDGDGYEQAA